MKIEYLAAHGISGRHIENWKVHYPGGLLPLQEKVIASTSLLRGGNVIVFAPTSSGKTFVAELAAIRQIEQGRKAVFLTPTKALAEEQYARLTHLYAGAGVRTAIATRERTLHDSRITCGDFDLAVMVYEKLKTFLTIAPELERMIGIVVVDELQILGDTERGAVVDLLLSRFALAHAANRVQLVCLSAVLGENARLASWLGSELFLLKERPVELREGVYCVESGNYHYREFNSGKESDETFAFREASLTSSQGPAPEPFNFPAIAQLIQHFASVGEQSIVFVPTRHLSRQWAWQLSHIVKLPAAQAALDELQAQEENHSRRLLEECFARAVAFHNSDLPHELRALVEREFNGGKLKVLVATSTLAQGVNLAARNVISVPAAMQGTPRGYAPSYAPLGRREFRNQGGRSGRLGMNNAVRSCTAAADLLVASRSDTGSDFGRSILVLDNAGAGLRAMRDYVFGEVEPLAAPIGRQWIDRVVLDLVHTGRGGCIADIRNGILSTYSSVLHWKGCEKELDDAIALSLRMLEETSLIATNSAGAIEPTGIGQAAAAFGILPATARDFAEACRAAGRNGIVEFAAIALCAFCADGKGFPLSVTKSETGRQKFPRMLATRHGDDIAGYPEPLRTLVSPAGGFPVAAQSCLKKAFIASAWISGTPTREIEEEFHVFAGTAANLAAHLGWLAQALCATAASLGLPSSACSRLSTLAERLPEGVTDAGLHLSRIGVRGLSRSFIEALVRDGFDSPQALAQAEIGVLSRIVPEGIAARSIAAAQKHCTEQDKEEPGFSAFLSKAIGPAVKSAAGEVKPQARSVIEKTPELIITPENPGSLWFRGHEIVLSRTPYNLALVLAEKPRLTVSYTEITERVWPDCIVEQQQILAHRKTLVDKLAAYCSPDEAKHLIETRYGQGLRLNIEPDAVRVSNRRAAACAV